MNLASVGRRLVSTTVIASILRIAGAGIALLTVAVITRQLGPEGFGEYSTVFAILFTFSLLSDFGLRQLLVRELARRPMEAARITGEILTLRLVLITGALALAILVTIFVPVYTREIKIGLLLGFLVFMPLSLLQVAGGLFQHNFQFERISIAEIAGRTIQLGGVLLVWWKDGGLFLFIAAAAAGGIASLLLAIYWARGIVPLRLRISLDRAKRFLKEAWPMAISMVFVLIYFKLDTILLSIMKSDREVGLYNVAYKVFESVIFFPALIAGLVLPILASSVQDKKAFRHIFQKVLHIIWLIAIPATVGLLALAKPITVLIGGRAFSEAATALRILALALLAVFPANIFGNAIIAVGKQRESMKVYVSGAVINVILNIIVIPKHSFVGAALTTLATEIFVTSWLAFILFRGGYFSARLKFCARPIAASFVMAGIILALPEWNVFFNILIGALSYALTLYAIGGVSPEDISVFLRDRGKKAHEIFFMQE